MHAALQLIIVYAATLVVLVFIVIISTRYQERRHVMLWAVVVGSLVFLLATYTRVQLVPFNADETRRDFLLTGDEPRYLMTALSIAKDGDLDLANNEAHKDYLLFQRSFSGAGRDFAFYNELTHNRIITQKKRWGGALYSPHNPGTSFLLAPVFLLANHNYRFWSYTVISLCFVFFCSFSIYYLQQVIQLPLDVILVVCLVCGLSPPVYFYMNQVFPELVAGILLALIGILFLKKKQSSLVPFVLAALAIWFTERAILASLLLCAAGFFYLPTKKLKFGAVVILGSSGVLFAWYCWLRFGVPYPILNNLKLSFSFAKTPQRLFQIFFDGKYGWVWLFPAVLLLPAMIWEVLKSKQRTLNHLSLVLALVVVLILIAAFDDRAGGTCPRGRYFVIPQFLFLVLSLVWLQPENGRMGKFFWIVGLGGLSLMQLFWLAPNPRWWFAGYHPLFYWKSIQPYFTYLPLLPDDADKSQWLRLFKITPLLIVPSLSCIFLKSRQIEKIF